MEGVKPSVKLLQDEELPDASEQTRQGFQDTSECPCNSVQDYDELDESQNVVKVQHGTAQAMDLEAEAGTRRAFYINRIVHLHHTLQQDFCHCSCGIARCTQRSAYGSQILMSSSLISLRVLLQATQQSSESKAAQTKAPEACRGCTIIDKVRILRNCWQGKLCGMRI